MPKFIALSLLIVLFSGCIHFEDDNTFETYSVDIDKSFVAQNIISDLEAGIGFWEIYGTKYHPSFFIGLEYGGGIIFHASETPKEVYIANGGFLRGGLLEQSFNDFSDSLITFLEPTLGEDLCLDNINSTSFAFGDGKENTEGIILNCGDAWSFAKLADQILISGLDYRGNQMEWDDWFLPSEAEVTTLATALANDLQTNGIDNSPIVVSTIPSSTYNAGQSFTVVNIDGYLGDFTTSQREINDYMYSADGDTLVFMIWDAVFIRTESEN